jgi:hypothetical protein
MSRAACTFEFPKGTPREFIEAHLAEAIFTAECVYGAPRVRNSAAYYVPMNKPQCAIDVSTEVGEHVAEVFTGLVTRDLGEDGFTVTRRFGSPGSNTERDGKP